MTAYYNENDAFNAAWLRELIKDGLIEDGEIDDRDIRDVRAADLYGFTQVHLFAGIGGWSHALRLAGWASDRPVWTGSCPCQPFSAAGKRRGFADERHLWPEMRRLVAECAPPVVFGEQVASKDGRLWLAGVRADLEALGYAVGAADLCAAGVGAPHIRQRLYWVADAGCEHGERWPYKQDTGHDVSRERHQTASSTQRNCTGGRLADSQRDTRDARRFTDELGEGAGASSAGSCVQFGRRSNLGGLADAVSAGRPERRPESGNGSTAWSRSRMGDADEPGLQGRGINAGEHTNQRITWPSSIPCNDGAGERGFTGNTRPPSPAGAWEHSIFVPCADGKARRVEPGIFPLAHGIPNRMGLLRGAGNAIVPQVAAEFIKSAYA